MYDHCLTHFYDTFFRVLSTSIECTIDYNPLKEFESMRNFKKSIFLLLFRKVKDLKNILCQFHKDPRLFTEIYDCKRSSFKRI